MRGTFMRGTFMRGTLMRGTFMCGGFMRATLMRSVLARGSIGAVFGGLAVTAAARGMHPLARSAAAPRNANGDRAAAKDGAARDNRQNPSRHLIEAATRHRHALLSFGNQK